ncbi:hypothetical protein BFN03_19585 [Rhodococcus sp. WMMA185]|uniref:DUF6973 domain-containing protein n=1 Tax=Rhodococcus sp. WMMA185 TaxID=679318 RepID=UPI0008788073|nr:hypothetical protein [Rhodococcus sp. WMMA185]AOW94144.1 hypothetical protein BFN03_19585 [Rhodococcus sp. WMMA185]
MSDAYGGGYVEAYALPQILGWNLDSTDEIGRKMRSKSEDIEDEIIAAGKSIDSSYEYWNSPAAETARDRAAENRSDGVRTAMVMESVSTVVDQYASNIRSQIAYIRDKVAEVEESEYQLFVEPDGGVRSRRSNVDWIAEWGVLGPARLAAKEAEEFFLENEIRKTLTRIQELDKEGAEQVARCLEGLSDAVKIGVTAVSTDPTLNEVLFKYQTAPSEAGASLWPSGEVLNAIRLVSPSYQPTLMTPEEVKMMMLLFHEHGPAGLVDLNRMKGAAESAAHEQFPESTADGHGDAFRHTYWNALMTKEFGGDWTADFATAHEGTGANSPHREAMDLYNNELGRRLALEHPDATPQEMQQIVLDAINGGEAIVMDGFGHIGWSDDVPVGVSQPPSSIDVPLPSGGN